MAASRARSFYRSSPCDLSEFFPCQSPLSPWIVPHGLTRMRDFSRPAECRATDRSSRWSPSTATSCTRRTSWRGIFAPNSCTPTVDVFPVSVSAHSVLSSTEFLVQYSVVFVSVTAPVSGSVGIFMAVLSAVENSWHFFIAFFQHSKFNHEILTSCNFISQKNQTEKSSWSFTKFVFWFLDFSRLIDC